MWRFLKARHFVVSLLVVFSIAACRDQSSQPLSNNDSAVSSASVDCRTVEHQGGKTKICGQPKRIVVLGPYVLEPLLALDVQPIGYADYEAFLQEDYTNPDAQIPYLGDRITQPLANVGLAEEPSIETIVKVQPDLILGVEGNDYNTLSKIAPTILLDRWNPDESLDIIAEAVNRTEQAEKVRVQTQQKIATAQKVFAPFIATHPRVAVLSSSKLREISIIGSVKPCGSLIEKLGFQLIFPPGMDSNQSISYTPISLESLPQLNDADSVILLGHDFEDLKLIDSVDGFEKHQLAKLKQAWKTNVIAQSLEASQAGRVYFVPIYICRGLPGPIGTELYLNKLKQQLLNPQTRL